MVYGRKPRSARTWTRDAPRRDAPQEARVALNILTGSKLVVKRIASKETKNPRVPVDGDALVAEVRFQSRSRLARSPLSFFFFPPRIGRGVEKRPLFRDRSKLALAPRRVRRT